MRAILLGSVMLAALSHAQVSNEISYKVGAGLFVPTGKGSETVTKGPRLSGMMGLKSGDIFELGFELAYNSYEADEEEFREALGMPGDLEIESYAHIIELNVAPTLYLIHTEAMALYGLFGAGIHFFNFSGTVSSGGESATDEHSEHRFGVNFGGGLELKATEKLKVGVSPRFHVVFEEEGNTKYFTALVYLKF